MGLIDWMMDSGLDPEDDRLVTGLMKRYGQYQLGEKAGESLLGKILPKSDVDKLDLENRQLDIRMKKRALGMDDSDEYDESRNNGSPLYAMTARHAMQAIPEPGFLAPTEGKILGISPSALKPFVREASHVAGPNGGSAIKRLARYFLK